MLALEARILLSKLYSDPHRYFRCGCGGRCFHPYHDLPLLEVENLTYVAAR